MALSIICGCFRFDDLAGKDIRLVDSQNYMLYFFTTYPDLFRIDDDKNMSGMSIHCILVVRYNYRNGNRNLWHAD